MHSGVSRCAQVWSQVCPSALRCVPRCTQVWCPRRALEDEKKARMGVVECAKHELLQPFNVLYEKEGETGTGGTPGGQVGTGDT